MRLGANGLRGVKDKDLRALLGFIHRDELPCPITQIGLAVVGLLRLGDELSHLRYLDKRGVSAVIIAVLAERDGR
jgi:hypothetical protein